METLDFLMMLTNNCHTNPNSIHLCFPMKMKKSADEVNDIDDDLITVNKVFAHFVKEISITRYGNDKQLMPTFSPYEIYQYSHAMLEDFPEKALRKLQNDLLYSKKKVSYNKATIERRTYNSTVPANITDDNLDDQLNNLKIS